MGKFKVGDMVVPKAGHYTDNTPGSSYNLPRRAMRVAESGVGYIVVEVANGETAPAMNPESFDLAEQHSPIRTVTRREIVPGKVEFSDDKHVWISVHGRNGLCFDFSSVYGAAELRDAAKLFNELADVLDENAV